LLSITFPPFCEEPLVRVNLAGVSRTLASMRFVDQPWYVALQLVQVTDEFY